MITFKTFQTADSFLYSKRLKAQAALRTKVQDFINHEVGIEQVISITESREFARLYLTVWYRTEEIQH